MMSMYQIYNGSTKAEETVVYNDCMMNAASEYFRANPSVRSCYVAMEYNGRMTRYEYINKNRVVVTG